jgi:hypothetical protein
MAIKPLYLLNQLAKQAELQRMRRESGRCVRCGSPAEPRRSGGYYARCETHRREQAWHKKRLPDMPANGWR